METAVLSITNKKKTQLARKEKKEETSATAASSTGTVKAEVKTEEGKQAEGGTVQVKEEKMDVDTEGGAPAATTQNAGAAAGSSQSKEEEK